MKTYLIINNNDGNDSFEIQALNATDAAHAALAELGWWVSQGLDADENEDEGNSHE